jgi:hypothetical protein
MAFDARVAELRSEVARDPVDDVSHGRGRRQELCKRGHAFVTDAARDDVIEHREVGLDVHRESMAGASPRDSDSDRGQLLVPHPDAGEAGSAVRGDVEVVVTIG